MTKRVLTGAGFALVMLLGIELRGGFMLALLSFSMLVGIFEMYRAIRATGTEPVRWAGYVFCGITIIAQFVCYYLIDRPFISMPVLLVSVMAGMTRLVQRGKIAMESLTATVFPMLYPGIFFMSIMDLVQMDNSAAVIVALMLSFFSASVNDMFALFTGMLFGKHKLAPELSPKKTIEGAVGGVAFCVLFTIFVPDLAKLIFARNELLRAEFIHLPPRWAFALLGLLLGVLSQVGDLVASMIKRHCGVKDFGKLLPGHGGIMDRLDGVLFCGAACSIFFRIVGLG